MYKTTERRQNWFSYFVNKMSQVTLIKRNINFCLAPLGSSGWSDLYRNLLSTTKSYWGFLLAHPSPENVCMFFIVMIILCTYIFVKQYFCALDRNIACAWHQCLCFKILYLHKILFYIRISKNMNILHFSYLWANTLTKFNC